MSVKITGYNNTHKEGTLYLFSGNDIVETLIGHFTKEEIDSIIDERNNPKPATVEVPEPTLEESKEELEELEEKLEEELEGELATFNGTANQEAPVTTEEMKELSEKTFEERVEEKINKAFDSDCSKYQEEIATLKKQNEDLDLKFQAVSHSKDLLEAELGKREKAYKELVETQNKKLEELNALKEQNQDLIKKCDVFESQNKLKDSEIEDLKRKISVKHSEQGIQEQLIPVPLASIPVKAESVLPGYFFTEISRLRFSKLALEIMKDTIGNLTVATVIKHEVKDEGLKNIKPFIITGSPEDLDKEYFNRASGPIEQVQELVDNSAEFLKAKELAEKESAAKKAVDDKIKKAEEAVNKLIKDDKIEDKDKAKVVKAVDALKKLDNENQVAKKALALLNPETSLFDSESEEKSTNQ